jgi:hypothetical protein
MIGLGGIVAGPERDEQGKPSMASSVLVIEFHCFGFFFG